MGDSWWDRTFQKITPPQPVGPSRYAPAKAARWEDSHPPTQAPVAPQPRPYDGTGVITAQEALNGQIENYQPDPHKVQSLRQENDLGPCPECGSPNFMSRRLGVSRGPSPAPRCADCGYLGGAVYWQETTGAKLGEATTASRQVNISGQIDFAHPIAHIK